MSRAALADGCLIGRGAGRGLRASCGGSLLA
ncbi:hypothetical protein STVIR_2615 [Streptomyces viridochromogenes Tue57]|uniref:Uncharacterized protein n=1 Tax=Streptomyces viridochromogenes Tue57 TaxID=1160705 RepID=L8PIZ2_STRVR|nr:hypothetical protein STVIR_2615 [Streptomyces viridochromogenes Tue57]